jgi:hypothetical protein
MNTKQKIEILQAKEANSETLVKVISAIITTLLTVAGAAYCLKGAFMHLVANF